MRGKAVEMEAKHTPGPWIIAVTAKSFQIRGHNPEALITTMNSGVNAPVGQEANAHLIAAAPELLEALKGLIWLSDEGQIIEAEPSHCGPLIADEAREAITKAMECGEDNE